MRLSDEEYGVISPEEFIPLAEKNGMILEIGMYVFREVCSFIKTHRIWEYGIETIDVNLSVVQCMQEKLYETLLAIMDEYGLDYHYISLEITETAAIVSRETLEQNMHQLTSRGMRFFLDDYGTGFSNTATIIEYPFHTIKMDKTIVWSAMENTKAMHALKYSMAMIKAMQMNVRGRDAGTGGSFGNYGLRLFPGLFVFQTGQRGGFFADAWQESGLCVKGRQRKHARNSGNQSSQRSFRTVWGGDLDE